MRYLSALLCSALLCYAPVEGYALTCIAPTLENAFKDASLVFAGHVESIGSPEKRSATRFYHSHTSKNLPEREATEAFYITKVTFNTVKVWKGKATKTYTVNLGHQYENYMPFEKGINYVIFSNVDDSGMPLIGECSPYENIGLNKGYITTILLDTINPNADEILGLNAIGNTFIGSRPETAKKTRRMVPEIEQLLEQMKPSPGKQDNSSTR